MLFFSQACSAEYDEKEYLFLKRLCQVVITLGSVQLIQMWVSNTMLFVKNLACCLSPDHGLFCYESCSLIGCWGF